MTTTLCQGECDVRGESANGVSFPPQVGDLRGR